MLIKFLPFVASVVSKLHFYIFVLLTPTTTTFVKAEVIFFVLYSKTRTNEVSFNEYIRKIYVDLSIYSVVAERVLLEKDYSLQGQKSILLVFIRHEFSRF